MAKQLSIWDRDDLPSEKATEINKDRMKVYGSPAPNMVMFAALISPILGIEVKPEQAAMILVQLKVMREVQGDFPLDYPDNLEDMAGFTNVLFMTKEARRGSDDSAAGA